MADRIRLIVLGGPTASGKSDLAISLAREFNGEIVNADSVQLYRGMDIGSAKVPLNHREEIPHHLVDVADIDDEWDVKRYEEEALKVVKSIVNRGRLPIVVGGSGFYIEALISGVKGPVGRNERIRSELSVLSEEELYQYLLNIDPIRASEIGRRDKKRLIRAIEIFLLTGEKPSSFKWKGIREGWDVLKIAVTRERAELKRRIEERVLRMIEVGWVRETEELLRRYGKRRILVDTLGYRELVLYLEGVISLETAIERIVRGTYDYAKRQIKWFRSRGYEFFKLDDERDRLFNRVREWLFDKADGREG